MIRSVSWDYTTLCLILFLVFEKEARPLLRYDRPFIKVSRLLQMSMAIRYGAILKFKDFTRSKSLYPEKVYVRFQRF